MGIKLSDIYNGKKKVVKEDEKKTLTSIIETSFAQTYYPFKSKDSKETESIIDFRYIPQDIISETTEELKKALTVIEETDSKDIREIIELLLIKGSSKPSYSEGNYRIGQRTYTLRSSTIIMTLVGSMKSSSFINFIDKVVLEKDVNNNIHPVIKGQVLSDMDSFMKKSCTHTIKGETVYEKIGYENLLRKYNTGLDILRWYGSVQNTVPLTSFLASICPKTALTAPNVFQVIREAVQIALTKDEEERFSRIEEIKGEAITFFYNVHNYVPTKDGQSSILHNSCMKGNGSSKQIDFYAVNEEAVSLLVKKDTTGKKIEARALLWTSINGTKLIDRIYYNREEDAMDLKAYASAKGYKNIHSIGSIPEKDSIEDYVVKLKLDTTSTRPPYFDSMRAVDTINSFFSLTTTILAKFAEMHKLKSYIINIYNGGFMDNMGRDIMDGYIYNNGLKRLDSIKNQSIKDIRGKPIKGSLSQYTFVDTPKKGLEYKKNVYLLKGFKYPVLKSIVLSWKNKYHSLKEYKYINRHGELTIGITDKKFLLWSDLLRSYILIKDSGYIEKYNSYFLKNKEARSILNNIVKDRLIKKLFSYKLVRLTEEGFKEVKKTIPCLPFASIDTQVIRPSRKFLIQPENVRGEYVFIKDIPVHYKYLKTIFKI